VTPGLRGHRGTRPPARRGHLRRSATTRARTPPSQRLATVIRGRFAAATGQPAARFSFHRGEGACPTCDGLGSVEIRLPYLPSEWLPCDACGGRRFAEDTEGLRMAFPDGVDRSIADVYDLTVDAALALWADDPAARRILRPLADVGLGYLGLGQGSPTLSGGEAQRVAAMVSLPRARRPLVVLDEPTTTTGGPRPADRRAPRARRPRPSSSSSTADVIAAQDWQLRLGRAAPGRRPALYAGPLGGHGRASARRWSRLPLPRAAPTIRSRARRPTTCATSVTIIRRRLRRSSGCLPGQVVARPRRLRGRGDPAGCPSPRCTSAKP
jgi:excinuclease ABC subunit A